MMYTIRNATERTKDNLNKYAEEHDITIAEALDQLVDFGLLHYEQNRKSPKKFRNAQDAMKNLPPW